MARPIARGDRNQRIMIRPWSVTAWLNEAALRKVCVALGQHIPLDAGGADWDGELDPDEQYQYRPDEPEVHRAGDVEQPDVLVVGRVEPALDSQAFMSRYAPPFAGGAAGSFEYHALYAAVLSTTSLEIISACPTPQSCRHSIVKVPGWVALNQSWL